MIGFSPGAEFVRQNAGHTTTMRELAKQLIDEGYQVVLFWLGERS